MSDWSEVCAAIVAELQYGTSSGQGGVSGLDPGTVPPAQVHQLEPWDPEEFVADGKRHLAVWPHPDGETTTPLGHDLHELTQLYVIQVWESSGTESTRRTRDEASAGTLLDLQNAVRARFYLQANQDLAAGVEQLWWIASAFPARLGQVRYFQAVVRARKPIPFD